MSAWIVSKKHIDYMVTAAIAAELIPGRHADEVGLILWLENEASVGYRYRGDFRGMADVDVDYEWQETPILSGGALAKTVACYDYQSCEHPSYEFSRAADLVKKLKERLSHVFPSKRTAEHFCQAMNATGAEADTSERRARGALITRRGLPNQRQYSG